MVWFHGGGNTAGHGGALIFDGSNLAARGAATNSQPQLASVEHNFETDPFSSKHKQRIRLHADSR
jgi:hypothetical protein